jgi:hypothetical protein
MKKNKNAAPLNVTPSAAKSTAAAPKVTQTDTAAPASEAITIIDVKHDAGFGNAIFLRGQGGGLR